MSAKKTAPACRSGMTASQRPWKYLGRKRGFTLLEMIGVLAVMGILAAVIVPNALQVIENAAVKAEATTTSNLADQIRTYVKQVGALPPAATWNTAIAPYSDSAPAQILTNKRGMDRIYVIDPNAPSQRVLLLSSMRASLPLPAAATVRANFAAIWNTPDAQLPPGFPAAWSTPATQTSANLGYLVIQRINLQPIFVSDLQSFTVTLNNTCTTSAVNYRLTPVSGLVLQGTIPAPAAATPLVPTAVSLPAVRPRDRLDLYRNGTYTTVGLAYVFSANSANALSFTFFDSNPPGNPFWRPQ